MHFFKTELFVGEDDLKYVILLPLYPQHWDYRWTPLCPVYGMLGMEPRPLCMLHKHSTN